MAKSNFDRAEDALHRTLSQMSHDKMVEKVTAAEGSKSPPVSPAEERLKTVNALKRVLKRLYSVDHTIYKKLGIKKKNFDPFLEGYANLSDAEWKEIVDLKAQADILAKESPPPPSDESPTELVQKERHKHIHKRFNVSERWIPLK